MQQQRKSVRLVPLRGGKPLHPLTIKPRDKDDCFIKEGVVVGRKELLECVWKACGCTNPKQKKRCKACGRLKEWAVKSVSRKMLRLQGNGDLRIKGINALEIVRVDGIKVKQQITHNDNRQTNPNNQEWQGPIRLRDGSILSIQRDDYLKDPMEFQVVYIVQDDHNETFPNVDNEPNNNETQQQHGDDSLSRPCTRQPQKDRPQQQQQTTGQQKEHTPTFSNSASSSSSSPPIKDTPDLMQRIGARIEREATEWTESRTVLSFSQPQTTHHQQQNQQQPRKDESIRSLPTPTEIVVVDKTESDKPRWTPKPVLLFVQLGRALPLKRIQILAEVARRKGALVVETLSGQPTHLVVDKAVNAAAVASRMGFPKGPPQLAAELQERGIQAVKPEWIVNSKNQLQSPQVYELWNGLLNVLPKKRRRKLFDQDQPDPQRQRQRQRLESTIVPTRNLELSKAFEKLSKLYKGAPLQRFDLWKALQFSLIAGRVRHLNFEIAKDPLRWEKLKAVKKIGPSALQMIREFLETGQISRVEGLETDPRRVAMTRMMNIWGVGPSKAAELVHEGYRTIDQVRKALSEGKLELTSRQLIGVECYEEFLEKMDRDEVESAAAIVRKAVRERFPSAAVDIMGSYRRGRKALGDIDLLITEPSYIKHTPKGAIGELVSRLQQRGFIAYHLTSIEGIQHGGGGPESSQSSTEQPASRKVETHFSSQLYMGVFYSPKAKGKRRRIDIKFYPLREKAYAQLYFTGSGYFNRSMRLWAKTIKKLRLNDHGLFPLGSAKHNVPTPLERLPMEATTEREVFDHLGLAYKAPQARDCFDAVIGKDGAASLKLEPNRTDLEEETQHQWVD